jgi:hypothetical protein
LESNPSLKTKISLKGDRYPRASSLLLMRIPTAKTEAVINSTVVNDFLHEKKLKANFLKDIQIWFD